MSVRTVDQLEAQLTKDLKWRTQEMFVFERIVATARQHEQPALLRGGLALLYAHWEGYIKTAGSSYLEYVSRLGLSLGDLRPELAAVALRSRISRLADEKSSRAHSELVRAIRDEGTSNAELPYTRATIRTRANLKFSEFESIMHSLGCSSDLHRANALLIDERLLGSRNEISHGERQYVELVDWIKMRDVVETILRDVRTQLSNAAATGAFRA
nr:MAE_28990/MAE_18760 family HEPN-like nuclease [uncultured Microbacterium sp.]